MAEIEFLLPTVQYGNVKVRATPEELGIEGVGDAAGLGVAAAVYLSAFTQGFKRGAAIDVSIDPTPTENEAQAAVQEIQQQLGATVVEDYDPQDPDGPGEEYDSAHEAQEQAQARTAGAAPWTSQVDAKPKPWETGKTAPNNAVKVAEVNW